MAFQTQQNEQDNRYENSSEELKKEICSIWQGLMDTVVNLKLDISIDSQMLKTMRDRTAISKASYAFSYSARN